MDSHLRDGGRRWRCESGVGAVYGDIGEVRYARTQHRNGVINGVDISDHQSIRVETIWKDKMVVLPSKIH